MRHFPAFFLLALCLWVAPVTHADAPRVDENSPDLRTLNLQSRIGELELVRDGDELLVQHNGHALTGKQYLALIDAQQQIRDRGGPLYTIFNITTLAGILWVTIGLLGQVLFTGRMIVQWLASEKEKRSVVPPAFWYMSLIGATMLMAYFIWRKDIVGVIGQSTGWGIYARNVYLIHKNKITVTRSAETPAARDVQDAPAALASDR